MRLKPTSIWRRNVGNDTMKHGKTKLKSLESAHISTTVDEFASYIRYDQ